jgi:hypothetical protein
MTGRIKSHFWDRISGEYPDEGPEPDDFDLEMLQIDAERAVARYEDALKKHEAQKGQQ